MTTFDDIYQRVGLLNAQLRRTGFPGSEVGHMLHRHLWEIVAQLNDRLGLHLSNTALDLRAEDGFLVIRFFSGCGGQPDDEVKVLVDRTFSCRTETTDLRPGAPTTE